MSSVFVQMICCLLLSTPTFLNAFSAVWPSYTIDLLKSPQSPLGHHNITTRDINLIGSLPMLGSFIGTIAGAFMSEFIGRKRTEITCGLLIALSWSIKATVSSIPVLLAARLILGIAGGVHLVTALVFISEITKPSLYGITVNLLFFMYNIGILISYLAGWFCSYYVICYMNLSLSVAFVVLMNILKDGPAYLIGKGMDKEALTSLKFYRGVSTTTQIVLDEMDYIKNQRDANKHRKSGLEKSPITEENEKLKLEDDKFETEDSSPWKVLCESKASQRVLITNAIVISLSLLTGISGIQSYAGQLFKLAAPSLSPDLCSVVLAIVMSISGVLALVVIDMFKRRTLILFSTIITTTSLFLLGTMLTWNWAPYWIVPCIVLLYCAGFQIGVSNVPFVQLGESLMPQVKSLGTSIATCCMFMSSFISLLIFVPSVEHLGLGYTFFIFALISAIATIIIYFIVKETKGVTFEIIQNMFEEGYLCRYPIKR